MSLIQCDNIVKTYGAGALETRALSGVSFRIEAGEFVALMGPSGSGKSTLMHILGLLDSQTSGRYVFDGEETSLTTPDELAEIRNQKIGFIFQSFNLLPRTTAFENVELPLLYDVYGLSRRAFKESPAHSGGGGGKGSGGSARSGSTETDAGGIFAHLSERVGRMWQGMSRVSHEERVMRALNSVGMAHRAQNYSNQLSGGEMQRVAIARALVNDPSVIFADEPTGNLDSKSGLQVMQILQELNDAGHTVILVTHETSTAAHAKRMLYLKDGQLIADDLITNRRIAKEEAELAK